MYSDGVDSVLISFWVVAFNVGRTARLFQDTFSEKSELRFRNFARNGKIIFRKTRNRGSRRCEYPTDKNLYIVINSVELHNMLYTLCKNLHEQTLSFAAADEIENPTG